MFNDITCFICLWNMYNSMVVAEQRYGIFDRLLNYNSVNLCPQFQINKRFGSFTIVCTYSSYGYIVVQWPERPHTQRPWPIHTNGAAWHHGELNFFHSPRDRHIVLHIIRPMKVDLYLYAASWIPFVYYFLFRFAVLEVFKLLRFT